MAFGRHFRNRRSKPKRRDPQREAKAAESYLRGRQKIEALVQRGITLNAKHVRMRPAAAAVKSVLQRGQ